MDFIALINSIKTFAFIFSIGGCCLYSHAQLNIHPLLRIELNDIEEDYKNFDFYNPTVNSINPAIGVKLDKSFEKTIKGFYSTTFAFKRALGRKTGLFANDSFEPEEYRLFTMDNAIGIQHLLTEKLSLGLSIDLLVQRLTILGYSQFGNKYTSFVFEGGISVLFNYQINRLGIELNFHQGLVVIDIHEDLKPSRYLALQFSYQFEWKKKE